MKQLTQSIDLSSVLNTGRLNEVCYGRFTVFLRFEHLNIAVTSACELSSPGEETWICDPENDPGGVSMFAKVLDSEIESYLVVAAAIPELILHFSNGYTLKLREYGEYESFTFYYEDGSFLEI